MSESSEEYEGPGNSPLSGGFVPSAQGKKTSFQENKGASIYLNVSNPGHKSPFDKMLRSQYYKDVYNWWNCFKNSEEICTEHRWSSPLPEFLHF